LLTYKIFQFLNLIAWYWITICKALFTWDRDETKLEWKLKLPTCLHMSTVGMKITKFSIYSPCQAIFFFRWLFFSMCCSLVPMSRLHPRAVWNVFVFTFIPVWIHAGLKWDWSKLFLSRSHVNIYYIEIVNMFTWDRYENHNRYENHFGLDNSSYRAQPHSIIVKCQ
jgi:hypothetical protein